MLGLVVLSLPLQVEAGDVIFSPQPTLVYVLLVTVVHFGLLFEVDVSILVAAHR